MEQESYLFCKQSDRLLAYEAGYNARAHANIGKKDKAMSNEPHSADTLLLAPFTAFMRENREQLIENISQQLFKQPFGAYQSLTSEQIRARVSEAIEPYFRPLTGQQPSPLEQQMDTILRPAVIQQAPIETVLQVIAAYRTGVLEFALAAVDQGIEGSTIGVQRLMALFDRAVQAVGRAYQAQLFLFQTLAENAPDGIGVAGPDGTMSYANPTMRAQLGYGDDLIGTPITTLIASDESSKLEELIQTLTQGRSWRGNLRYQRKDQSQFIGNVSCYPLRDTQGNPLANVAIVRDITAQLEAEAERQQLQQHLIEAQQAALAELSTPLIPISDAVMVMPLIGLIDSGRATQLVERLLEGVVESTLR